MTQKYHILTLGCQMNKSDSERIARVLEECNYIKADDEKSADLIVINSCSVRQSANNRIYGKARNWNKEKVQRHKNGESPLITILAGCVLPRDKKKLKPLFDFVLDIKKLKQLPQLLKGLTNPIGFVKPSGDNNYFQIKPIYQNPWSAYVPIMTGCDNFCSYCAVPHTRGREVSRSVEEILLEVKNLVDNDCLEITLLGQNVNTYRPTPTPPTPPIRGDERRRSPLSGGVGGVGVGVVVGVNNPYQDPFAALLWEINQMPKLNRLHFTAPHPKDMSDEVIDALTLPKMVNFLHLPVQAGDDEILKKMNRHYAADDYLELIKKIQLKKPNIALGTDIIVGFPSETKKQFENTVKLFKKVQFDISYTAKYSERSGTAAAKLDDDVNIAEKKRRWEVLKKLMEKIVLEKNQQYAGEIVEVLIDKKIKKANLYEGNSREYKRVRFYSEKNLLGKVVDVKISKALTWILEGEV